MKQRAWGLIAASWLLSTGRWGSYLPFQPIFFADIFLFFALCSQFFTFKSPKLKVIPGSLKSFLALFFLYISIRILFTNEISVMSTLRDFVPYFYVVFILIGIRESQSCSPLRVKKLLVFSLYFHMFWFLFSTWFPNLKFRTLIINVSQQLYVFDVRADFDSAIAACFIGYLMINEITSKIQLWKYFMVIISSLTILRTGSRSAFLALITVFILIVYFYIQRNRGFRPSRARRSSIGFIFLLLPLIFYSASIFTNIDDRLVGTFSDNKVSTVEVSASGTWKARQSTWGRLLDYSSESPARLFFGVGFGSDYMLDSGAKRLLVGDPSFTSQTSRHPHNYWINTLLRTGLVGLLLVILILFNSSRIIFRQRGKLFSDSILTTWIFIVLTLLVTTSFGVILESPFGAIPFYYGLGYLLGHLLPEKQFYPISSTAPAKKVI